LVDPPPAFFTGLVTGQIQALKWFRNYWAKKGNPPEANSSGTQKEN